MLASTSGRCADNAVGEIVASGGRSPGWPLTGPFCELHGELICIRAPMLDPTARVEFRRYA
jgi:hypothetical protein